MKILLAGTEPRRLQRLRTGPLRSRHQVKIAQTSAQAWQTVMRERIDVVVLDTTAGSVDLDPWRLSADLHQTISAHVIALIRAGKNRDRVRAFREGASLCLTMPVSPLELAACLDNLPRPRRTLVSDQSAKSNTLYVDPTLHIDIAKHLVLRGSNVYSLSPRQAVLLRCLLRNTGRIVSRDDLCEAVWFGDAATKVEKRLKIYISMLRQKIEQDPKHPCYIISHRGTGYGFFPHPYPGFSEEQPEATRARSERESAAVAAENGVGGCEEQAENRGLPSC